MRNPNKKAPAIRLLNLLLMVSLLVTVLAPLTGIVIHKLASTLFLLLCLIHTFLHRKRLKSRSILLLSLVLASFVSGLFGLIFDQIPVVLALHKVISIGCTAFLAIHIFIFHRRMV